jgi:hypothetical protein
MSPDPADREALQDALKRVRNDADAMLTKTKLEPLREAMLHSIRDIIEAHEWLSSSRQIGEAGATRLAAISLNAASERLAYVTQLRDTYGAGVMFHE